MLEMAANDIPELKGRYGSRKGGRVEEAWSESENRQRGKWRGTRNGHLQLEGRKRVQIN